MTQHPPRRRAIGTSLWTLLAALAAPLASPAQPALTNASPLESPIPASRATFAVPGAEAPRAPRATPTDTLVFAHAALRRSQIELVPALERMGAASDDQVIAQPMLAGVTAELRRTRSRSSVIQLLDRTASSLDAMCAESAGLRRRSCRAMTIQLTAARAHVRAGRRADARRALGSLARHADDAVQKGTFASWEGTVIGETAKYAIERV